MKTLNSLFVRSLVAVGVAGSLISISAAGVNPGGYDPAPSMYRQNGGWISYSHYNYGPIEEGGEQHYVTSYLLCNYDNSANRRGGAGAILKNYSANVNWNPEGLWEVQPPSVGNLYINRTDGYTGRAYAKYNPVNNEIPAAPTSNTVLYASSGEIKHDWLPGQIGNLPAKTPGVSDTDNGMPGINLVSAHTGHKHTPAHGIDVSLITGNWTIQYGDEAVAEDLPMTVFQYDYDGQWYIRAQAFVGDFVFRNETFATMPQTAVVSAYESRAMKMTWVDGKQIDSGWVPEDVDGKGEVGPADLQALVDAYGTAQGDPGWNPFADIDRDLEVGPGDMQLLLDAFGESVQFELSTSPVNIEYPFW